MAELTSALILVASAITVFAAGYVFGRSQGYRAGYQARVGDVVMDAMKKSSRECMAATRELTKDFMRKAYGVSGHDLIAQASLDVRDGRQAPDMRQHSEDELAQEQLEEDGLNHSEPEVDGVFDKATPEEIRAIRRSHFETLILGVKGVLPTLSDEDMLNRIIFTDFHSDPFGNAVFSRTDIPMAALMMEVMGLTPSADEIKVAVDRIVAREKEEWAAAPETEEFWDTSGPRHQWTRAVRAKPPWNQEVHEKIAREAYLNSVWAPHPNIGGGIHYSFVGEKWAGATRDQRLAWANAALDKIFEMKMAQPHENGVRVLTNEELLAQLKQRDEAVAVASCLPDIPRPMPDSEDDLI